MGCCASKPDPVSVHPTAERPHTTDCLDVKSIIDSLKKKGYDVGQPLGTGVSAVVYAGVRKSDGMKVAVKAMSLLQFENPRFKGLGEAEIAIMRQVGAHENVVSMVDHFQDKQCLYIILERCDGGELMQRIQQDNIFSEKVASAYFRQILLGVQHCHRRLVVHRDLKPENFIFAKPGDDAVLKLGDFGLAQAIPAPDTVLTKSCGTSYYIAPEVLFRKYTKACDVWSCGVILYLMLSGTVPFGFEAKNTFRMFSEIKSAPLKFFARSWQDVSPSCMELITGLLERDPEKRYTIEEALDHPWTRGDTASSKVIMPHIIQSLLAFQNRSKFKMEALRRVANKFSANQMKHIRTAFLDMDTDRTGTVTIREMQSAMQRSGYVSQDDAAQIMKATDVNNDGEISYDEFVLAAAQKAMEDHTSHVWNAFCEFDVDNDGRITVDELAHALAEPVEMIKPYIAEYDLNHDGTVDFKEFMAMLLPGRPEPLLASHSGSSAYREEQEAKGRCTPVLEDVTEG